MLFKFMEKFKIYTWYEIDAVRRAKVWNTFQMLFHRMTSTFGIGIAYVKYEKASAAARAMEEMNGTVIAPHVRPLKVCFLSFEILRPFEFLL